MLDFVVAPTLVALSSPPEKSNIVGIPLTPYLVGVFGSLSILCLAITTSDISSEMLLAAKYAARKHLEFIHNAFSYEVYAPRKNLETTDMRQIRATNGRNLAEHGLNRAKMPYYN